MTLRAVKTIWIREIRVHLRDKAGVISSVARSVLWLIVFGSGFGAARFSGMEVNYQEYLFPGIVAMSLLFTSMRSGISVIWDREFGFMKEILVSPAPRLAIMAGKVAGGSTIAVMEGAVILLIGPLFGLKITLTSLAAAVAIMFLISLSLVSIGLIVSAVMKSFEGFQTIMTFLIMPMFFMSGALFPIENLPAWMKPIVYVNLLTYGVDALRITMLGAGQHTMAADLAVISLAALATMLAGTRAFRNKD